MLFYRTHVEGGDQLCDIAKRRATSVLKLKAAASRCGAPLTPYVVYLVKTRPRSYPPARVAIIQASTEWRLCERRRACLGTQYHLVCVGVGVLCESRVHRAGNGLSPAAAASGTGRTECVPQTEPQVVSQSNKAAASSALALSKHTDHSGHSQPEAAITD